MNELSFTKQHTAFIKGIAILLMIWHHALIPEFYVSPEPLLRSWKIIHLSMGGKFCVGLFTFIIGYGYACSNNRVFSYSLNHIWKLLKKYWVLSLLLFIPLGILFGGGNLMDWQTILFNLLGLKFQYNCASWFVLFYVFAMIAIIPLSVVADRKPYFSLVFSIIIFGILATFIPAKDNCLFDAFSRWCHYTPILLVGYVAAKREWITLMPDLPASVYVIIAFMVMVARCFAGSIKGFSTDTILVPIFVFAIVVYLNKVILVAWVKKIFERLGKVSMYMWFLHAIFFSTYTKAIFQTKLFWVNNPFAAFLLTTIVSYLLSEVAVYISNKLLKLQ